jgi:hypothetical protein
MLEIVAENIVPAWLIASLSPKEIDGAGGREAIPGPDAAVAASVVAEITPASEIEILEPELKRDLIEAAGTRTDVPPLETTRESEGASHC